VGLSEELGEIAGRSAALAGPGEELAGVLAVEPAAGARLYVCSFAAGAERSWVVVDAGALPVEERARVREAVSVAALCEIAAETAGGGELEELRAQLVALRLREAPPGVEDAEEAALELERVIGVPPRVASPAYLDEVGAATRRLERALGQQGPSPFAAAMADAAGVIEALVDEVERTYRGELR
jgi:hypothetical protein